MTERCLRAHLVIQHHNNLASNVTNELVTGSCITERVNRLAGNEIELGMEIPMIESSTSWFIRWDHRGTCGSQHGYPDPAVGYWPETCLGHVYIVLEPVGSARLKFDDGYIIEFMCFDVSKVVQSPGYGHGHDEESRNDWDIKINILDDYIWTSEWFRVKSGFYRSIGRLPEPPGNCMGLNGP